jgi:hypothetical protein
MATIRTYTAPLDRLRPDDRGFAAQETAARRISAKTTEEAGRLRESGKLAADVIRMQAAYDKEIAPIAAPASRGGGGGGGGSPSRGHSAPSQIAGPREAAQVGAGLAKILGGMEPNTSGPRWLTRDPLSLRNPNSMPPYIPFTPSDELPLPYSPGIIPDADYSPGGPGGVRQPGGNLQDYGYGTGGAPDYGGAEYGPPSTSAPTTMQRLGGFIQEYAGAIASGFSAAYEAARSETDTGIDYVPNPYTD